MNSERQKRPLVFDIARGSFVDGPGIRTVVFLKGCPLRCVWCHNPEGQELDAEYGIGSYYSPEALSRVIAKDLAFYRASGGGVTFSGGEPLMHCRFLMQTCMLVKKSDIHVAIETSGFFDWQQFDRHMKRFTDLIIFDLKLFRPNEHLTFTGQTNRKILANLKHIQDEKLELQVRIPLVPGIIATEENLRQWAGFLKRSGIRDVKLLPYNPSGIKKWEKLGKQSPPALREEPLSLREERHWNDFFLEIYSQI